MKTQILVSALGLAAASVASADFVNYTTNYAGNIGGRDVWHVFANFNEADDILLSFFDNQTTSGNQNGVLHNDFAGGSWNPDFPFLPEQCLNDSYVTIGGEWCGNSSTQVDMGSSMPSAWYTINPGSPIMAGAAGTFSGGLYSVKIMQAALATGDGGWSATLTAGWKESTSSTTALFGFGSYSVGVPAPGALALLGLAGTMGRRSRR